MRNGSFTVKDFRLYDETSSSKGRSPGDHIAKTSYRSYLHLCRNKIARLADEFIAFWLLLAANVRKILAPATR